MEMIRVRSSAITAIGYDPAIQRMQIKFIEGHTYTFCRVPSHIFDGLLASISKGTYYNNYIRDKYQC